jgi:hypothetical protein
MRAFDQRVPNIIYNYVWHLEILKTQRLFLNLYQILKDSKRYVKAPSHANARV